MSTDKLDLGVDWHAEHVEPGTRYTDQPTRTVPPGWYVCGRLRVPDDDLEGARFEIRITGMQDLRENDVDRQIAHIVADALNEATVKGFTTVTLHMKSGDRQVIGERTASPYLAITPDPDALTELGHQAFGSWCITHVPSGKHIPTIHGHDLETVRWMAGEFAKSDIDWTAPLDDVVTAVMPLWHELNDKANQAEAENTPPGQIPPSTMRLICEQNDRIARAKQEAGQ